MINTFYRSIDWSRVPRFASCRGTILCAFPVGVCRGGMVGFVSNDYFPEIGNVPLSIGRGLLGCEDEPISYEGNIKCKYLLIEGGLLQ